MAAFDWYGAADGADLLGGLGGVAGSLFGGAGADNARRRAEGNLASWRALYGDLNPIVQAGYEDTVNLGPSAMEGVASEVDPALRAQQLSVLRSLMGMANEGGMDPQSRAALLQAQASAAREARAQQGAIRQSFQGRGMGGGGLELGLANAAAQQSANANAMAGVQAAADSRTRALQALSQGAGLAGQVRGQDYAQAADRAGARDRVNAYNAQNQQATRGRNIDRQYGAAQQTFANRLARAGGEAGALGARTNYDLSEAERRAGRAQGVGSAIGRGLGYVGGGFLGGW